VFLGGSPGAAGSQNFMDGLKAVSRSTRTEAVKRSALKLAVRAMKARVPFAQYREI